MMEISTAILCVKEFHAGQMDKSGKPYWHHPVRVMLRLGPNAKKEEREAALIHDTMEDTDYKIPQLRNMGFSLPALNAVWILHRWSSDTYEQYIDFIIKTKNITALRVKLADNFDNNSPGRIALLPKEYRHLHDRYNKAERKIRDSVDPSLISDIIQGDLSDSLLRQHL